MSQSNRPYMWAWRGGKCSFALAWAAALASGTPQEPAAGAERAPGAADELGPGWSRTEISVKFRSGQSIRVRDGALTDLGTGALDGARGTLAHYAGGRWKRSHQVAEEELDRMRGIAERNLGRPLADLNLQFRLELPEGASASQAVADFRALEVVQTACGVPTPMVLPTAPDLRDEQGYLTQAPYGFGFGSAWGIHDPTNIAFPAASRGSGIDVADIEYDFNEMHVDLPWVQVVGPPAYSPAGITDNHGTCVLGELVARDDGNGTSGAVPWSNPYFAEAAEPNNPFDPYDDTLRIEMAISDLTNVFGDGDVILIEQQIAGPNYTGVGQNGLVPVEWYEPIYDAIVQAVGNGIVVVEAAGNGAENLDSSVYVGDPLALHEPFLPQNDSGAIIVGAGSAPSTTSDGRVLLSFSNYGSTVDLQGWGEKVATTGINEYWGYGDLYNAGGYNEAYTATFSGTSSASPLVAAACVQLRAIHFAKRNFHLSPSRVREVLRHTGSPQQGAGGNIGPRPDVMKALVALRLHDQQELAWGFDIQSQFPGGLGLDGDVYALATYDDDGTGPRPAAVYAGGAFTKAGNIDAYNIARWNGGSWSALDWPSGVGLNGPVRALCVHDPDGSGAQREKLYVAGEFTWAGGVWTNGLACWDGTSWSAVTGGLGGVWPYGYALASFDEDGTGPQKPTLFVGGDFDTVGTSALWSPRVARWRNGTWLAAGSGFDGRVNALHVYDYFAGDAIPPRMLAGGYFQWSGGLQTRCLAQWNGTAWSEFAGGANAAVHCFASWPVVTVGTPSYMLFAGGDFTVVGNVAASFAAEWLAETTWINLQTYANLPLNGPVRAMTVADDGFTPNNQVVYRRIYMGGDLYDPNLPWMGRILCYSPGTASWTSVDELHGFWGNRVHALASLDEDGSGFATSDVYAGGVFQRTNTMQMWHFGRVFGKPRTVLTYCSGKLNSEGCTPTMQSSGTPSATALGGFTISSYGNIADKAGILFYGLNGRRSTPYQGGTLCVETPLRRTRTLYSGPSTGTLCEGVFELDMNAFAAGVVGGNPDPALTEIGTQVNCQFWGRDPGYAPPNNSSLSPGIEYMVGP